ncbi:hypothetical protein ACG873_03980 [Mesorhizobium sp. AaZ16]|uniref:hypothetical protein n=1 Tax=Mesorhizobium sp. AaZ16 TaxID=3402289 RepID=UPI00374F3E12
MVVGLPEFDTATNQYFNSAVLIGLDGEVAGTYRKRNTLIEASGRTDPCGRYAPWTHSGGNLC